MRSWRGGGLGFRRRQLCHHRRQRALHQISQGTGAAESLGEQRRQPRELAPIIKISNCLAATSPWFKSNPPGHKRFFVGWTLPSTAEQNRLNSEAQTPREQTKPAQ